MDSDEEEDFIYNPLKLPMGWDGKPIPYWLYKLHGLNQASGPCISPPTMFSGWPYSLLLMNARYRL